MTQLTALVNIEHQDDNQLRIELYTPGDDPTDLTKPHYPIQLLATQVTGDCITPTGVGVPGGDLGRALNGVFVGTTFDDEATPYKLAASA